MSWAEVKKINGDMNVALDELIKERMTYVCGLYPRGRAARVATADHTSAKTETVVDIRGRGVVFAAQLYGYVGQYVASQATSTMTMTVDDKQTITFSQSVPVGAGESRIAKIQFSGTAVASDVDITESQVSVSGNRTLTLNTPIVFEKSLKCVLNTTAANSSSAHCQGSITYYLAEN